MARPRAAPTREIRPTGRGEAQPGRPPPCTSVDEIAAARIARKWTRSYATHAAGDGRCRAGMFVNHGGDVLETPTVQRLDYASPRGGRRFFCTVLSLFAVGGILTNLAFIAMFTQQLHQAQWVYHDLVQDPRAYGREIDPAIIAWLRDLRPIWTSFVAFGIALAFG